MRDEFRAPRTDSEWAAYHAIRRHVLFELRGDGAAYNQNHPDEHRAGHFPFLLWVDGVPVGVIRVDIDGAIATFRRVAIRNDVQGQGFGRRLLQAAEDFARDRGCVRIDSHIDPGAIGFYERCGFARADSASSGGAVLMTRLLD